MALGALGSLPFCPWRFLLAPARRRGRGGRLEGVGECVSRCVVHTQKDGAGRRVVKDGAFLFAARPSYPLSGLPSPVSGPMALFLRPALPAFFSLARVVSAPRFS